MVVGGTAMIFQGFVTRTTSDVDVIAVVRQTSAELDRSLEPPEPLPEVLQEAISRIARDFNLPGDWMNTTIGQQWLTGLPPGFEERVHWKQYGGLRLGLADRRDLVFLKLFAAADSSGPESVHYQDLVASKPTDEELDAAADWIRSQDTLVEFSEILDQVLEHYKKHD